MSVEMRVGWMVETVRLIDANPGNVTGVSTRTVVPAYLPAFRLL